MEDGKLIKLTASEITPLWSQYLNDSASVCVLTYFLEKVEDEEIKKLLEHSLRLSESHIHKLTGIFKEENFAIPQGFSVEKDVESNAPKLFSDVYMLNYLYQMSKIGMTNYSGALNGSVRQDITEYYQDCLTETMELFRITKDLLLNKGLLQRPPSLPKLDEVDYVEKQGFIWDVFGEKRPLISAEVSNLFSNLQRNSLGAVTLTGFSQVATEKEVKNYFLRGIDIAKKHTKVFGGKLEKDNLPAPMSLSAEVTNSTAKTFSDKLMMFFASALNSLSVGYYGTASSQSPRVDLGLMYNRLSLEVQKYSEDGANIMIKNSWMEQPPMNADRGELANKKHKK